MRQEVERRYEERTLDESVNDYGEIIRPPRSSSLIIVDEDEYKIRAHTPSTTKKTLLQRMCMSARRGNTPEPTQTHLTSTPAPAHMPPKASALLLTPRVGYAASARLRSKKTGFFSRKHRSADEEDIIHFGQGSPSKVPVSIAGCRGSPTSMSPGSDPYKLHRLASATHATKHFAAFFNLCLENAVEMEMEMEIQEGGGGGG